MSVNDQHLCSIIALAWLLHSLKREPVMTRQDCSTLTNLAMLSLHDVCAYTHGTIYQNMHAFYDLKLCILLQTKISECLHVVDLQFEPR